MVKISKQSWHFWLCEKYCDFFEAPTPETICRYVWSVVGAVVGIPIGVVLIALIVLAGLVVSLFSMLREWISKEDTWLGCGLQDLQSKICPEIEYSDE